MEQEREDYSDSPKAQPLSPERVHAGCAVAAILYPFACIFLMGLTWRWFVGTPLDRLVWNSPRRVDTGLRVTDCVRTRPGTGTPASSVGVAGCRRPRCTRRDRK